MILLFNESRCFILFILRLALITLFVSTRATSYGQETKFNERNVNFAYYNKSLDSLTRLLETNGKFSTGVYLVENTYNNYSLSYKDFEYAINYLTNFAEQYRKLQKLKKYNDLDSINYLTNYAIFTSLFDTVEIVEKQYKISTIPFSYSSIDPIGKKDWSNMFVTKLLATHKGNCHSLTYLYKILADELHAKCWLALAPSHIYIRNYSRKIGWYNTELTSSVFPTDAWIATTGYISTDAIRSGIYMDTLSNQQSIALCVLDLAKCYEFQTRNYYDGFILKCCDLVLKYHSVNPMALLLKAETLKKVYFKQTEEGTPDSTGTYTAMENTYITLAKLHYREMPEKMYLQWLESLIRQKNKYTNKKAQQAVKTTKPK
jgi:hypothetical protein